jgi:GTP-binding protein EngB required for normal cell division
MGHPNAGKSSVVATLTENDRIQIDKRAGTTTAADHYPVVIDGKTVVEFIDTPGFQNPSFILEWFQAHPDEPDLARAFVDLHCADPLYVHDCTLLRPVAEGAAIILVVDGSKRIKEKDRAEIELLRLTGRPRMAILNNTTNVTDYMDQWQDMLNKAFNAVREFNAHRATYDERMRLMAALKTIDQRWEDRIDETIETFARDWDRRIDQTVTTIIGLLKEAMALRVTEIVDVKDRGSAVEREAIKAKLTESFEDALRKLETKAQDEVRGHFRHNVWNISPESILQKDLFSEEVGQALGLSRSQLALVGAAAGATTGATLDLSFGGTTLGAAALLGAATGGALGVFGGAALAKIDIQKAIGIERISMGPVTNPRFPFVLLDRILLYCARAMNWSHGRQAADEDAPNRVPDRELPTRKAFTEELATDQQKKLAKFFATVRKGKESRDLEEACRQTIRGVLRGLSESKIDSRADL